MMYIKFGTKTGEKSNLYWQQSFTAGSDIRRDYLQQKACAGFVHCSKN